MLSSSPASLNRAREVLLSSSEQASFFSCPQPMTSSVESDLQSSREEVFFVFFANARNYIHTQRFAHCDGFRSKN
jgi:DNA repair protein RadC